MSEDQREQETVLIVDDTLDNLNLLIKCLEDADYRVSVGQNGEEALERVAYALPDLILLDVMMPGMNGFETCRRLKEQQDAKDIPIIFMTVSSELVDKVEGFAAGGVDYITKPFQAEEVLARIRTHLTMRKLQRNLNKLVEERTRELTRSNALLQQEIEGRKQKEKELRRSRRQYRTLAEHVADGIGIIRKGKWMFVNPALCSILGYSAEQLLRIPPEELLGDGCRERFHTMQQRPEGGESAQFQCTTGDGRDIWVEHHYRQIEWLDAPAVLITLRDITASKLHEAELEEERTRLEYENLTLRSSIHDRYKFGDIIGKSSAMQEVYGAIVRAASSKANVLICGESGTGKELVARSIHQLSDRKDRAFVTVNCGAVPEALFEREFFGHRKSAFTGATADKPGYFDKAHGGTLFLDEVAELSPQLQVKLLRALEYKEYTPLGDNRSKQVDLRIISATNNDLRNSLQQGDIRKDFFYRIRVIALDLPPLRERPEDIPLLAEHFLKVYGNGHSLSTLPTKVIDALCNYHWPGNVRELQNELQRYLAEQRLEFIGNDLEADSGPLLDFDPLQMPFNSAIELFEKQIIANALAQQNGHRSKTAAMLDLPSKTLYNKIKKYGL